MSEKKIWDYKFLKTWLPKTPFLYLYGLWLFGLVWVTFHFFLSTYEIIKNYLVKFYWEGLDLKRSAEFYPYPGVDYIRWVNKCCRKWAFFFYGITTHKILCSENAISPNLGPCTFELWDKKTQKFYPRKYFLETAERLHF